MEKVVFFCTLIFYFTWLKIYKAPCCSLDLKEDLDQFYNKQIMIDPTR